VLNRIQEPHAASALLNANKKIDAAIQKNEKTHRLQTQQQPKRPTDMRRTASSTATGSSTPHGKLNYFMTPPLSRTSSQMGQSTPGTPHYGSDVRFPLPIRWSLVRSFGMQLN
jgi:hypothetical protein